jgi:LPS export ABC transporter protein LptC
MRDRITMLIAIVLLAAVTATSYWYSRQMRRPPAPERAVAGTADFVVERVVLTQFDEQGRARHRLFADRLTHYAVTDDVDLVAPRLLGMHEGRPQTQARAQTARVENGGERVHLRGSVVLTREATGNSEPLRVTTEYLLAIPDYDRYSTDRPVQIRRGGDRLNADRMELDNIERTIRLGGRVHTVLEPPPS